MLVVTLLAACCVVTVTASHGERGTVDDRDTVCTSPVCRSIGEEIASRLKHDGQICQDFYSYACGKWHWFNQIPRGRTWWDQHTKAEENIKERFKDILYEDRPDDIPLLKAAKQYHRACMNQDEERIQVVRRILDEHGGWPILNQLNSGNIDYTKWQLVDRNYSRLTSSATFYSLDVELKDGAFVLSLDVPRLLVPASFLTSNETLSKKNTYRAMIRDIVTRFADDHNWHPAQVASLTRDVSDLLQFEIELAKIIQDARDNNITEFTSIGNFQSAYDESMSLSVYWHSRGLPAPSPMLPKCLYKVNWIDDISSLLHVDDPQRLHDYTPLIVRHTRYFKNLCRLLEQTPEKVILNYVHWRVVSTLLPYANIDARNILLRASNHVPLNVRSFSLEPDQRFDECLQGNEMKDILYYQLLRTYFPREVDDKVFDVVNAIDMETNREFHKASNTFYSESDMHRVVRYESAKYRKKPDASARIPLQEFGSSFVARHLQQQYYRSERNFLRLSEKPSDDNEDAWVKPAWSSRVTADIVRGNNSIEIPSASLYPPFFSVELPWSYLFGAFGVRIAQASSEILNRYSAISLAKRDRELYDRLLRCYHTHDYMGLEDPANETAVLTEYRTLREEPQPASDKFPWSHKIQDAIGLDVAYRAYKRRTSIRGKENTRLPGLERFNDDQLFFIAYANANCEMPTRRMFDANAPWREDGRVYNNRDMLNNAIKNSPFFGEVFNCQRGYPTNPWNKCSFWTDQSPK